MAIGLTTHGLTQILGREVEETHLTIAKASVLGLDPETIANTIGIDKAEVQELMETQDYKDVRLLVGAEVAKEKVERDLGWDGLENIALRKLTKRAELENDTDTILKIAAVANRATRRSAPPKESVLDPSQAGARVPLTLTRRFTEKLNGQGQTIERTEIQQISVLNGSAVNPTFKEVNQLLRPEAQPRTQEAYIENQTQAPAEEDEPFSLESLKELAKGIRR